VVNTILQLGADISDTLEKEYVLSIPSDNEEVVFRVRAAVNEDKKNAAYGLMSGAITEYGRILGEQNAHRAILCAVVSCLQREKNDIQKKI
jgi:hypothetical protein